jgi:hypothetical protein
MAVVTIVKGKIICRKLISVISGIIPYYKCNITPALKLADKPGFNHQPVRVRQSRTNQVG